VAKIQGGPLDNDGPGSEGTGQIELMVPGGKVGLIIGKNGETIKQLQVCRKMLGVRWIQDVWIRS